MSTSTPEYGQKNIESVEIGAVNGMTPSVSLADPMLFDTPLIGVSAGFEEMTGYPQAEIVGQNCRFLNTGVMLEDDLRLRLRKAVALGTEFVGVLQNRRKTGELFLNLLHMTTLRVQNRAYIVGIQVNVTDCGFDVCDSTIRKELQQVVDRIFQASLDVWIDMAASDFNVSLPVPYSQLLSGYKEQSYEYSRINGVQVEQSLDAAMQNICASQNKTCVYQKNTFMHVKEAPHEDDVVTVLRRCQSEPTMSAGKCYEFQTHSFLTRPPLVQRNLARGRDFDSESASSRPTDQPNDTTSDCSYHTDDMDSSTYHNSRGGDSGDSTYDQANSRGYPYSDGRSSNATSGVPNSYQGQKRMKGAKENHMTSTTSGSSQEDTTDVPTDGATSTCGGMSNQDQNNQNTSYSFAEISSNKRLDWADSIDIDVKTGLSSPDSLTADANLFGETPPVLKSIGSAGHPSQCCECQFFFFSLTGCKKGQDCRYCHEFHPRAKEKKNRKLRRRLDEVGQRMEKLGIDATHSFKKSGGLEPSFDQGSQGKPQKPNPNEKASAPKVTEQCKEEPADLGSVQQNEVKFSEGKTRLPEGYVPIAPEQGLAEWTPSLLGENLGKFSLMYLTTSAKREFVFAVGQQVNLEPMLLSSEDNPATTAQKDCLTYSVSPPLPEGLQLDPKTGIISGIVAEPAGYGTVEHAIKVGVRILAAWNKMVLGSMTLCEVRIKVRVVNLMSIQHQIRWIHGGSGDSLKIEFNDVQCYDDDAWRMTQQPIISV
jgi:PAS domain S-box-containing protein